MSIELYFNTIYSNINFKYRTTRQHLDGSDGCLLFSYITYLRYIISDECVFVWNFGVNIFGWKLAQKRLLAKN